MNKDQIVTLTMLRPSLLILNVTMGIDEKIHWALEFVRITKKSVRSLKVQHKSCFTQPFSTKSNCHGCKLAPLSNKIYQFLWLDNYTHSQR